MSALKTFGIAAAATVPIVAGIGAYAYAKDRGMSGLMSLGIAAAGVAVGNVAATYGIGAIMDSGAATMDFTGIGRDYITSGASGQYIPAVAPKAFGSLMTPSDVLKANYFSGIGMQTVPRVVRHDWSR